MKKTATLFFIIFLVIILGVYIYLVNGLSVHSVISTSIKNVNKGKSIMTENQKAELYQSQFIQNYYLVPTSNIYNTQTSK